MLSENGPVTKRRYGMSVPITKPAPWDRSDILNVMPKLKSVQCDSSTEEQNRSQTIGTVKSASKVSTHIGHSVVYCEVC